MQGRRYLEKQRSEHGDRKSDPPLIPLGESRSPIHTAGGSRSSAPTIQRSTMNLSGVRLANSGEFRAEMSYRAGTYMLRAVDDAQNREDHGVLRFARLAAAPASALTQRRVESSLNTGRNVAAIKHHQHETKTAQTRANWPRARGCSDLAEVFRAK